MSKLSYYQNINASMSPALLAAIHDTIEMNKRYAMVVWKSRCDDALDATLHHAIKYYSRDKGELRNYIISTMKNILTNSMKKESSMEDEALYYHVDSKQEDDTSSIDDYLESASDELEDCVKSFLPSIVLDYEFFATLKKAKMRGEYSEILSIYSPETILGALQFIQQNYLPELEEFMSFSGRINNVIPNESLEALKKTYKSKMDFVGEQGNTVLVKGTSPKSLVKLNLDTVVESIIDSKYCGNPLLEKTFLDRTFYRSPSGGILRSREELRVSLKEVLFYFLCKRIGLEYVGEGEELYYFLGNINDFAYPVYTSVYNFPLVGVNRKEF